MAFSLTGYGDSEVRHSLRPTRALPAGGPEV